MYLLSELAWDRPLSGHREAVSLRLRNNASATLTKDRYPCSGTEVSPMLRALDGPGLAGHGLLQPIGKIFT